MWLYTQYKLKRCSKKECCKQCRYAKLKGTITKWPVQKLTHSDTKTRTTSWRNRHLEKNYIFVLSKLSIKGAEHKSQYFYSLFNISAQGPLSKYEKLLNIYILFCNKVAQRQNTKY